MAGRRIMGGHGDPCNLQAPWTVLLQGPEVAFGANARQSLVFNPAFPCGIERGLTFAAGDDVPLITLARYSGCVGEDCPGAMVLVRGHVAALSRNVDDSTFPAFPAVKQPTRIGECEGISTYPRIKLAVYACGWAQPVIIDADSQIIVPAGLLRIDVLGPGPSTAASSDFGLGSWREGPNTIPQEEIWVDVNLRVTACPCDCYVPPGVLTEYLMTVDDPGIDNRILLRPRRAKRLQIAPTLVTVITAWLRDTTALLPIYGQSVWTTGAAIPPPVMEIVGAAPALAHAVPGGGTNTSYIRWEIV